jgi:hypothetical protein
LWGARLSEQNVAPSNGFLEHFQKNYHQKIEDYIKWTYRQSLSTKILIVGMTVVMVIVTLVSSLGPTFALVSSIMFWFFVGLLCCWLALILISGNRIGSLNVKDKDILVYFLVQAADKYHAFLTEKGEQEFLDDCITDVSSFTSRLERLLANADMPLKLPNVSQLVTFNENFKHLIIPALRQRRDYPATPQGRDFGEVFVSLARLFFYEKGYEQLPEINKAIAEKLKDIEAEPEEEKGKSTKRLLGSNKVLLPASLIGVAAIVLLIVYIFRAMQYEASTYWSYVADNATQLAVAIVGSWIVLFVAIVYNRTRAKA